MSIIQYGQSEDMYGKNESTLLVLQDISRVNKEIENDLENFMKAIVKFNKIGIEIDISIKIDNIIFKKSD